MQGKDPLEQEVSFGAKQSEAHDLSSLKDKLNRGRTGKAHRGETG